MKEVTIIGIDLAKRSFQLRIPVYLTAGSDSI